MAKTNTYSYADLYPSWGGVDTSNLAVPESDDMAVLNEDADTAEKADVKTAGTKNIFLALGLFVALVIFFGGGK